jgi:hypothetical protein
MINEVRFSNSFQTLGQYRLMLSEAWGRYEVVQTSFCWNLYPYIAEFLLCVPTQWVLHAAKSVIAPSRIYATDYKWSNLNKSPVPSGTTTVCVNEVFSSYICNVFGIYCSTYKECISDWVIRFSWRGLWRWLSSGTWRYLHFQGRRVKLYFRYGGNRFLWNVRKIYQTTQLHKAAIFKV